VLTALAGGVGARNCSPASSRWSTRPNHRHRQHRRRRVLHGLHISPDLDTVTYTLAGLDNKETGWGLAGETWTVMDALERLGGETCSAR